MRYLKHGYGKVSDHATREIRFGRLSREEGVHLVKKHVEKKLNSREEAPPDEWD